MHGAGLEEGAVEKDWEGRLPIGLIYPNRYCVGMGNLAIHYIYSRLNDIDDVLCERIFIPDDPRVKLLSLEGGHELKDFSALLISVSFENDFQNVIKMMDRGHVEANALERNGDPIIVMGGPAVTLHPNAMSWVADALFIGEVDDVVEEIVDALKKNRSKQLKALASIEGMYVPRMMKAPPKRVRADDLDKWPVHSTIDADNAAFGDMYLIEMGRGCPHACRYCTVPALYKPCRFRSADVLWKCAKAGLSKGKRIGLINPAVLSHPAFEELASRIIRAGGQFSTSSIRADEVTKKKAKLLSEGGMKSVSIGVETGDEAARFKLGKRIDDETYVNAARLLSEAGIKKLKLYFMIGLPGEGERDWQGIVDLSKKVKRSGGKGFHVEAVLSPFVPKPGTPMAEEKFAGASGLKAAEKFTRPRLLKLGIKVSRRAIRDAVKEYKSGDVSLIHKMRPL